MKTLYLKTTMKLLRLLPALIFFILALSYNARSQYADPNPVCYGQPIHLFCSMAGCGIGGATYTWQNLSGSWMISGTMEGNTELNLDAPSINVGENGYATDLFFLYIQYAPPPGGFSGGSVQVNLLPEIFVNATIVPVKCFGAATGSINITATGGRPGFTYHWSNGSTARNQSGLTAGTYTVTVTDTKSCPKVSSFTVGGPSSAIDASNALVTNVKCANGNDGAINLTVIGGTSPYTFHWSSGPVTEDISNLTAGNYTVTITDAASCTLTNSWQVTQPSALSLSGGSLPVLCNGGNTGSIGITPGGGTPPYTFKWSNSATIEDISGLTAGNYTVTVTDHNLCTITGSYNVAQPDALTLNGTPVPVSCNAGNNGSIGITVGGGMGPYGFVWSNGLHIEDISGLTAGTYTVTVTDYNNCTISRSWEVTQPSAYFGDAVPTPVSCFGGNDGSINLTIGGATPPYTFSWSNGSASEDLTGLTAGVYTVTVTDHNLCIITGSWQVTQPAHPLGLSGEASPVLCYGGNTGSIGISVDGGTAGYSYSWSNGASSEDISGLTAGVYTVLVTDANHCTISDSWQVTQPLALALDGAATPMSCFGVNSGSVNITPSNGTGPYTFLWSNFAVSEDITGLSAGVYTVTVTDHNLCTITGSWEVTQPAELMISGSALPAACYAGSTGSISIDVTGGTGAYTYDWSNGLHIEDITGLTAGDYTVTVTDANSCTKTDSFTVGAPSALSVDAILKNVSCKDTPTGAINITVTGGTSPYGYVWNTDETTEDISGLYAGDYTVTITDLNNCTLVGSWTITEPSRVTWIGSVTNVLCHGGSDGYINGTTYGGTSPYTYVWSSGQTVEDISGLTAGIYHLTVTDFNGCPTITYREVTEPPLLVVNPVAVVTNISCNGVADGTINITVTGGTPDYSFVWSSGQFTEDITGLTAGIYSVTVTDHNQCKAYGSWEVTQPDPLTATSTKVDVLCNGGNNGSIDLTVSGGTKPYTYSWSSGQSTEDISGLTAGCYYVTVTDANHCVAYDGKCITEPYALTLEGVPSPVLCHGGNTGSINIFVGGGTLDYTYLWSNGQSSEDISGLTAGVYTVLVTDANHCTISDSWQVTQPDALTLDGTPLPVLCHGGNTGSIGITPGGGIGPYTFVWSNSQLIEDISGLTAGVYTVTVTDHNLCTITGSWEVTQPAEIMISGTALPVSCNGGGNGSISIDVTGGTGAYTYDWSNGLHIEDITGLTAGDYTVTVTDANSCTKTDSFTVGAPSALSVDAILKNVSCKDTPTGAINITVTGGTSPYGYVWNTDETTEDISGLYAGDYTVTITDLNNCTLVGSWTITEPSRVTWIGSVTNVLCHGGSDGYINGTTYGGTSPYTYVWSSGQTVEDISGLTAGIYHLTVTDFNGCPTITYREVTEPPLLVVNPVAVVTNISCNGVADGTINITVTGGTPDYSFVWSSGQFTEDITGLTAGIYSVTVTDHNQCKAYGSWEVTQPDPLTATSTKVDVLCNGGNNGSIDLTVSGGTKPYTYSWSSGQSTEDISGLTAGCYYVTVTDANHCVAYDGKCITQPEPLVIGQAVVTDVTCNGASNGSIDGGTVDHVILPIPVSGGTPPYAFIWSNGYTTNTACCLTAGCYTVTVTDYNSCTTTESWCVHEPPALSLVSTLTNVLCHGNSNGAIDILVTGGIPDYTYTWSTGTTATNSTGINGISGLTAGIYTVTVSDGGGCRLINTWEVTQPNELRVTGIPTDVLCNGGSTGAVDISVTGGTSPYSYFWSSGQTVDDITGLTAGVYTVTVYDHNRCMATGSWTVNEPSALSLSASITDVNCYTYSTGAIDLTVTGGTSPYGYEWSNGKTTQDITGLPGGTYTVTVTDHHLCQATASYFVNQPPMWSIGIYGPLHACCKTSEPADTSTYTAVIGGTYAPPLVYHWIVEGGVIVGAHNTSTIKVIWSCCNIGKVWLTVDQGPIPCTLTTSIDVIVTPTPTPVIIGPVSVIAKDTAWYCVENGDITHLYEWTVSSNGTIIDGWGSSCIKVAWGDYPVCGCGWVNVCESTQIVPGCTGCTRIHITVLPKQDEINLSGTVYYKNNIAYPLTPGTPLNGVTVTLRNTTTNAIVGTTVTGPNMNYPYTGDPGYYAFMNVPAGNYKLEATYNGTWGGNNATDALLIQYEAGAVPGTYLSGLNRIVADVNASLSVTALDALYVKLRTVGSISSYPAGDWKFENPTFAVAAVPVTKDFAGLCVGDVNGSFIPTGMKAASFLSVIDDATQIIPVEETFAYEIRSNMVAKLGAMTLYMGYDKDRFEVIDVTASSNDEMKYVIEDGNVAIAWADTKAMSVRNDDQIFTLTVKAKAPLAEATQIFDVKPGSEFASPAGIRYDNFDLKMSKVITAGGSKEFSVNNYPNPFKDNTKIVYTLPESGKVTLVITDMFGKTIRTLVNEFQKAGNYSISVNAAELNLTSGVYLYRIEAAGATDTYVKVNKMIFTR